MPSYPPIKSTLRSLEVLRLLNRRRFNTIGDLHQRSGLPKPTLVRILETLIKAGYVSSDPRQGGYQVTSMVTSLSSGFHGDHLAVEAGRAWAIQLTRQLLWPVALAVLDQDACVVRFSTVPDSPISPFHATINMRLSLVSRALGRAYLAFCPDGERDILLNILGKSQDPEDAMSQHPDQLAKLLDTIRAQGFAERDPGVHPTNSSTIAVPIYQDNRVLATMGLTYFTTAVSHDQVVSQFADALKVAAAGVAKEIAVMQSVSLASETGSRDQSG